MVKSMHQKSILLGMWKTFIVIGVSKELLGNGVKLVIIQFLKERGLELF